MSTIRQSNSINAPIERVWKALVDPKDITAWGAGPAKMSDKIGFNFSLWDGDIFGKNLQVVKYKKLVQEWFGGKWDTPSKATFTLQEKDGVTKIDLLHENVPEKEYKSIVEGWKDYYLGPMKKYLEGG